MTTVAPRKLAHAPHPYFRVDAAELTIGGVAVSTLAERVGQTPFYAYDRAAIGKRIAELRQALPPEISLHYAIKANPMPAVVAHIAPLVDGLDLASAGELAVALDIGANPAHISFAGPGKTDSELHRAAAAGICVNVESEREIRVLAAYSRARGIRPRVAIRVNPDFELKTSGMKMGGGPKQNACRRCCGTSPVCRWTLSAFISTAVRRTCAPTRSPRPSTRRSSSRSHCLRTRQPPSSC